MYRIAVVDDEPKILSGIVAMLQELLKEKAAVQGFQSAQALLREQEQTDILITDICMPETDGLELGRIIRERFPGSRIIIISGYDDFDYARSAIKLRVWEYLLKPIDRKQLEKVVLSALQDIEKEQEAAGADVREASLGELLGRMLFFKDERAKEAARERFQDESGPFRLYYLEYQNAGTEGNETGAMAGNKTGNVTENTAENVAGNTSETGRWERMVCSGKIQNCFIDKERMIFLEREEIPEEFWEFFCARADEEGEKLSIGISRKHSGFDRIEKAFGQAQAAAKRGIYGTQSGIYAYDGVKWLDFDIEKFILAILNDLSNGKIREFYAAFGQLFLQVRKEMPSVHNLKDILLRIVNDLQYVLDKIDVGIEQYRYVEDMLSETDAWKSLDEIERAVYGYLDEITREVNRNKKNRMEQKIQQTAEYVETHFRSDLSLNDVAETIHVNPAYFSTCFKKYTGYSFVDYLTKLRIEEAKRCLGDTHRRISTIAEEIGFRDAKYFAKIFKKSVGVTPSEYRDLLYEIRKEEQR